MKGDLCYKARSEERQTSLKFWYICHFLNNYDLNKGRFIVSRSPGRLPRGFCISNQRLFVLSGWTPPSSTSWSIPPSSPSSCTPSTLLKNGEQPMCSNILAGSMLSCVTVCPTFWEIIMRYRTIQGDFFNNYFLPPKVMTSSELNTTDQGVDCFYQ